MGYTHYWYRSEEIDRETFSRIVADFRKLLPEFERAGVPLAGPDGHGEPIIEEDEVSFNGSRHCGHEVSAVERRIGIPWPTHDAKGVFATEDVVAGPWYAGTLVTTRVCDGDCSYETFDFPRVYHPRRWEERTKDGWFQFCKTAFRPYDLAVTAFLVVAKHYMGESLTVESDGEPANWMDAVVLCRIVLGYGEVPLSQED